MAVDSLELPGGRVDDGEVALRPARPADAADLARGVRDAAIVRFASVHWGTDTVEQLAERIHTVWPEAAREAKRLDLVIADATDDSVLGYLVVFGVSRRHGHCEVGFWLAPEARGRGAAVRAIDLACRWAHADGFFRVQAATAVTNVAAQRALLKARFTHEGVMRSYIPAHDGTRLDFEMYSRLATD